MICRILLSIAGGRRGCQSLAEFYAPWRAAVVLVMLTLPMMLLASSPLHAQTKSAMCWPAEELTATAGEERIKRAGRSGLIAPSKRMPMSAPPIPVEERLPIRRVKLPKGMKLVALTFDLCEQPYEFAGYQGDLVDFLRKEEIKATFFAGGKWMLTHQKRAQQLMADPLFEMGNHTWEHHNLRLLTGGSLFKEIARAQTAYEDVRKDLARKQCLGFDGRLAHQRSTGTSRSVPVSLRSLQPRSRWTPWARWACAPFSGTFRRGTHGSGRRPSGW